MKIPNRPAAVISANLSAESGLGSPKATVAEAMGRPGGQRNKSEDLPFYNTDSRLSRIRASVSVKQGFSAHVPYALPDCRHLSVLNFIGSPFLKRPRRSLPGKDFLLSYIKLNYIKPMNSKFRSGWLLLALAGVGTFPATAVAQTPVCVASAAVGGIMKAALKGTYTIGASGADFPYFNSALNALSNGVEG